MHPAIQGLVIATQRCLSKGSLLNYSGGSHQSVNWLSSSGSSLVEVSKQVTVRYNYRSVHYINRWCCETDLAIFAKCIRPRCSDITGNATALIYEIAQPTYLTRRARESLKVEVPAICIVYNKSEYKQTNVGKFQKQPHRRIAVLVSCRYILSSHRQILSQVIWKT